MPDYRKMYDEISKIATNGNFRIETFAFHKRHPTGKGFNPDINPREIVEQAYDLKDEAGKSVAEVIITQDEKNKDQINVVFKIKVHSENLFNFLMNINKQYNLNNISIIDIKDDETANNFYACAKEKSQHIKIAQGAKRTFIEKAAQKGLITDKEKTELLTMAAADPQQAVNTNLTWWGAFSSVAKDAFNAAKDTPSALVQVWGQKDEIANSAASNAAAAASQAQQVATSMGKGVMQFAASAVNTSLGAMRKGKEVLGLGNTALNTNTFIDLLENFKETHTAEETLALYKIIITHYINPHKLYGNNLLEISKRHAAENYTGLDYVMDTPALYEDKSLFKVMQEFAAQHANKENGTLGEGAKNLIEAAVLTSWGHQVIDRKLVETYIYDTLRGGTLKNKNNHGFTKKDLISMQLHHAVAVLSRALRKPIILAARFATRAYVRHQDYYIEYAKTIVNDKIGDVADNKGFKAKLAKMLQEYNLVDNVDKEVLRKRIEEHLIKSGLLDKLVDNVVHNKLDKLHNKTFGAASRSIHNAKNKVWQAKKSVTKHLTTSYKREKKPNKHDENSNNNAHPNKPSNNKAPS